MKNKKNILITGGMGRIGYYFSEEMAKQGHNVVSSDIKISNLQKKNLKKYKNHHFIKTDITIEKDLKKLIKFSIHNLKNIDVVLHCAYPKTKDWGKSFLNLNKKSLYLNICNNLGATIIFAKLITQQFLKQKKGKFIFFSSIYGLSIPRFEDYPNPNKIYSPLEYVAIKSAIISVTKYLGKFFKKKNLQFNCISPGGLREKKQTKKFVLNYKKHCNSKGFLDPSDLSGVISLLTSDHSKLINGQNIVVDDGWTL